MWSNEPISLKTLDPNQIRRLSQDVVVPLSHERTRRPGMSPIQWKFSLKKGYLLSIYAIEKNK